MRAAVMHEIQQPLAVEEIDVESPREGEVLVRIAASGVCRSDLHALEGESPVSQPPMVLGHEGAGVVEELGPGVTAVQPGDPVILNWAPDCGHCFYCSRAQPALCETFAPVRRSGTMLDGTTRFRLNGESVSITITARRARLSPRLRGCSSFGPKSTLTGRGSIMTSWTSILNSR